MTTISHNDRRRLLAQSQLLAGFVEADADRLAPRLVERRFADGQVIFGRGEPGSSLFALVEGRVRIGVTSADGREVLLDILGPGEIFGELALLDGRPRSADATAFGPCLLLSLDRRELLPALRRSPAAASRLLELVCGRLRVANDQLEGAVSMTVGARLARLLLALADRNGGPAAHALGRIDAALSQADLARLIGAGRQKVNRHLCRWLGDGTLARDGRALVIRDRHTLSAIAEAGEG
jgi:CRP-like cAMP-binding protein